MSEQMRMSFDGIPDEPDVPYTMAQMNRAFSLLDEYEYIVNKHPAIESQLIELAQSEAMTNGYVGSRWLGEEWRRLTRNSFTNNLIPVFARRAIAGEPLLVQYIHTKPCPIDAAMQIRAGQKNEKNETARD